MAHRVSFPSNFFPPRIKHPISAVPEIRTVVVHRLGHLGKLLVKGPHVVIIVIVVVVCAEVERTVLGFRVIAITVTIRSAPTEPPTPAGLLEVVFLLRFLGLTLHTDELPLYEGMVLLADPPAAYVAEVCCGLAAVPEREKSPFNSAVRHLTLPLS